MRQNMGKLTLSETYMVLFYYTAGKHTDIYLPQNSAGIVLGGIYGLLQSGCVEKEKNGRLAVCKPLPSDYTGLEEMYANIKRHSKTTTKWLDYYCCSPSQKNIKLLVDDLQESLVQRQMIKVQVKKGIFRQRRVISLCEKETEEVVRAFREAMNREVPDEDTAFLVQMLLLSGVLKKYFSVQERGRIRKMIEQCRHTEIWKDMEPYVNRIKNFNFQNTINSGAMYQ